MGETAPQGGPVNGEARVAAWLRANPGGQAWQHEDGSWHGSCPVNGLRSLTAPFCATAEELAGVLEALPAACAEVRLVEAEFPGWVARLWSDGIWRAVRPFGRHDVPLGVSALDTAGLRDAIRHADATLKEAAR